MPRTVTPLRRTPPSTFARDGGNGVSPSVPGPASRRGDLPQVVRGNGFRVAELEDGDIHRMAELVESYLDLPLGIVDAAVVAIAERLALKEIATLDHRHFSVV